MALDKQTFRTRTLTAIVFVVIMLAGLLINAYTFLCLMALIFCGCAYEFFKILRKINPRGYLIFLPLLFFYIIMPVALLTDLAIGLNTPPGAGGLILTYNNLFPCAIIFSIWINDTMAYLVGSFIGRTQLSPISPKKTWEGTIGGVVLCVLVIALLGFLIPKASGISVVHWMMIAFICAVFGTLGDLLESKLKRLAGVKDSGKIMPGHGGFLDRFDSFLVAIPFVWLYVKLFL